MGARKKFHPPDFGFLIQPKRKPKGALTRHSYFIRRKDGCINFELIWPPAPKQEENNWQLFKHFWQPKKKDLTKMKHVDAVLIYNGPISGKKFAAALLAEHGIFELPF